MKQSLRYFFFSSTVFLLLVLSIGIVYGMDVSNVKGTIKDGDVSHDFGNAILKVSPETAKSMDNNFQQVLTITNKYNDNLYYFISDYSNEIKESTISVIGFKDVQVPNYIENCVSIYNSTSGKNDLVCGMVQSGTKTETQQYYTTIKANTSAWGNSKNTYTTEGVLFKSGETKQFLIQYKTLTQTGKWNARIWSATTDDWTTIEDNKKTALFDYVIDPSFVQTFYANLTNCWDFDGAGNDSVGLGTNSTFTSVGGATFNFTGGIKGGHARLIKDAGYLTSSANYSWTTASQPFTMCYWTNYTQRCGSGSCALFNLNGNKFYTWFEEISGGQYIMEYSISPNSLTVYPPFITTDVWQYYCYQYNSSYRAIWKNGVLLNSSTTSSAVSGGNGIWMIGRYSANDEANMGIDIVKRFNAVLNSTQLLYDYNSGAGISCSEIYGASDTSNFTVQANVTFSTTAVETSNQNYYVNFSYHNLNISNISNVTFNIGYLLAGVTATQVSNGSSGNTSWQYFGVTNQRPVLNPTLATTPYYLNFTYNANFVNGTVNYTSIVNQTQQITMTYTPINIFIETPIIETSTTIFNASYNITGGNTSAVNFLYITTWNNTNITGTHLINNSNQINSTFTYTTPMLNSTDLTKLFTITPYLNVTFNGTTVARNGSSGGVILSANQMMWRMLLDNCTNTSINVSVINFSIQDTNGTIVPSADLLSNYVVYVTSVSNSRNYSFYDVNTATPKLCSYTNFGTMYLNWQLNYTGDGGRVGNSVKTSQAITNTSYNYTLYFVGQYTIRLFNESDNSVFDPAITTSTILNVYCTNSTEEIVLNTSTQGATITCSDWQFMRVYVTMNNETYYRTLQPTWYNATNSSTTIDWFLIDLDVDTAVRKIFTLNDLGGQYRNGYLKIQKIIGTTTQTIHQESWDVENKIQAYFMLNDLYSLIISDNENSTRVLGNFLADSTVEHEITVPNIPFQPTQTIDDFQWSYTYNELGGWLFMQYQSLNGTTYNVTYLIVNNSNESQVFLNVSFNTSSGSANYTSMLNGTIYKTYLSFNHSSYSTHLDTKLWGMFKLADDFLNGLSDPVGFKKWFAFIIIIASGLLFSGLSITAGAVTMTTMTWLFYVLGWLNLTVGVVPGSVILGLFTLITIGVLFVGEGIR